MPTDTAANLDSRSLTHLGNFALTTTRALAMAERLPARTGDSAFFDFFGLGVVQYPISWGWALVVLAVLLLVTAPVRNVGTSWPRIAWATLGAGWLFVGAALLCHLIAIPLYDYGAIGMRERVNEMAPFMWVCIAVCSGLTLILRPKVTSWIGSVVLLTIIALVAQQWLPGASWLFGWAAAVGAGMVALAARTRIDTPVLLVVCVVLGGIWGALLLQGVITTYVSTAPITPAPIALIVPFALALIGPLIILFGKSNWTRLVPAGLLGMAAAGVLLLALTSSFSPRKPKPGDLFHLTDTNISKAFLATTSGPRQLPPGLARRFMPTGFSYFAFWRVPWSDTLVIPPSLTIVQSNGRATLRMAGNGEPHRAMMFLIKPSSDLQNASLNGKPVVLTGGVPTRISYRPQTNGDMALTFDSASGGNLEIDYLYATPGMPAGTPAPDGPTTDWTWFSGTRMVIGSTTLVW